MTNRESDQLARLSVKARVAGCEVTIDVSAAPDAFKDRLNQVLSQLTEIGVEPLPHASALSAGAGRPEGSEGSTSADDPLAALAREIDVTAGDLRRVLGFKGENVQLFKPGQYSLADAISILGLAYEKGLGRAGMPFDIFSSLVVANHIKTKTPLRTVCFNLIRDGRFDKKSYEDGGLIVLTPAAEDYAAKALKAVIAGEKPARRGSRKTQRPKRH